MKKNIKNIERKNQRSKNPMEECSRFETCNAPVCPLDEEAHLRMRYPEDDICVYCRTKKKKGIRLRMPKELRKLVPGKNVHLLSQKNR